jgi:CopG family nickel-responsive transcriptional regulator
MSVVRFSVSLEEKLLQELDEYVGNNNFANRSQGLRYLIEKNIVEEKWQCNNIVAGAVIIIYDQQKKDIITRSNEIRHNFFDVILSSQHFHLNQDICLEVIAVRGKAKKLTELADTLIAIKGIKHGKLLMSKTD